VHLFWRALYGLLAAPPVDSGLVLMLKGVRAILGQRAVDALIARGEHRFAFSGWPTHQPAWINLHMSRFFRQLRRGLDGHRPIAAPLASRSATDGTLHVGCVAHFSGHLGFPPALFAAKPAAVHLTLFDAVYTGARAPNLRRLADKYVAADLDSNQGIAEAAGAINDATLDLLVNSDAKAGAYMLLDQVETPCVVQYCPGSDLLYHPRVSMQLHGQPQADYFVRDYRMFCGTTRRPFGPYMVVPFAGIYDRRDIAIGCGRPWRQREPLVVFHGALYKIARPEVLSALFELLAEDRTVEFVMAGKERAAESARIREIAARCGVAKRVRVMPPFSAMRDGSGVVSDPGWAVLKELLSRARLAPAQWPIGGASARLEAYALGTPSVHMGVRFDRASWGRPQPSVTEIPHLLVPSGTAWSKAEYQNLCRRCLHDEDFATRVVQEQTVVAHRVTDAHEWWRQLLASHELWRLDGSGRPLDS